MPTTTEMMQASATELQLAAKKQSTLACLPPQLLYIAAQFASRDEAKQALQYIHVYAQDGIVSIESTDGHRAFRAELTNQKDDSFGIWFCEGSLLIQRSAFAKRVSYASFAFFKEDGTVDILGGRPKRGASTMPTDLIESRPWKVSTGFSFPSIRQLFPDTFSNAPGAPISWNARYVAEFMTEVSRFSPNGIAKMQTNGPTTPLIFSSDCEVYGCQNVALQYLLMPVQVRR